MVRKGCLHSLGFLVLCFVIVIVSVSLSSAALGIGPAFRDINFQPNLEQDISYTVLSSGTGREILIYAEGDMAKYVTIDKTSVFGDGHFNVHLKLPENYAGFSPGVHVIAITIEEKVDKEVAFIGTRIIAKSSIRIYIPYPGKYLEISDFQVQSGNVGDTASFEFELINRGQEDLYISPKIEIYSKDKKVDTLSLTRRPLKYGERIRLKKELLTHDYKQGMYKASLIVDYGAEKPVTQDMEFKLGDLSVGIKSYTKKFVIGGLKKFELDLESNWNNRIPIVYAHIYIMREGYVIDEFLTTPTELKPLGKGKVYGYFESTNRTVNEYIFNTTIYYGENATSTEALKVRFVDKDYTKFIWTIVGFSGGGLVLIILIIIVIVKLIIWRYKKKLSLNNVKSDKSLRKRKKDGAEKKK